MHTTNNILQQTHFEDNPNDLNFLRHDKVLHPTRIRPHMKHIPSYLMPKVAYSAVNEQSETSDVGHVYFRGSSSNKHRKGRKGFVQVRNISIPLVIKVDL